MSRTIEAIIRHAVPARPTTIPGQKHITANWQNGLELGGLVQRKLRLTIASAPALTAAN